jgi:glycosyltransferase involved in cell wall biosynthesis
MLFEFIFNFVIICYYILIFKPNLLHVHWLNSIGSFVAVFLAKVFKIPIMITAWGSDINDLVNKKTGFYRKYLVSYQLKNANHITCDAKHLKNSMVTLGAQRNLISIINFGVDTSYFKPSPSKSRLRNKLHLDTSCIWILSNRPFEDVYDIETIVKAFFEIQKQNSNIKLLLVGKGSKDLEIKLLINELNIRDKIVLRDSLTDTEFLEAIQLTDYYISAAKSDGGIASSVAEAMACEIICFVSNYGENGDWVVPGISGFLFEIGDFSGLAKLMNEVINLRNSVSHIGERAREKIVLELNSVIETEKIISSYNNLVRVA